MLRRGHEAAQIEDSGELVGIGQVLQDHIGSVEIAGSFLDLVLQFFIPLAGADHRDEADDLGRVIAEDARSAGCPTENIAGRIERENGMIGAAAPH